MKNYIQKNGPGIFAAILFNFPTLSRVFIVVVHAMSWLMVI